MPSVQEGSAISSGIIVDSDVGGAWIDDCLTLGGDQGGNLLDAVLALLAKQNPRQRKLKAKAPAWRRQIDCLLANALRGYFFRARPEIAYSRGAEEYKDGPSWMRGRSLSKAVDQLARAGLLTSTIGMWGARRDMWFGSASTYKLTASLLGLAAEHGVGQASVMRLIPPVSQFVVLTRGGDDRRPLAFDETEETTDWKLRLDRYNRFVHQADIWVDLSDRAISSWLKRPQKDVARRLKQPAMTDIEYFRCHLSRKFTNSTFENGGRLYGAWWIDLASWMRRKILIDDTPTIEADYGGMSVRMIYHSKGLPFTNDPYELPELVDCAAKMGFGPRHWRNSVKQIMAALLNGSDPDHDIQIRDINPSFSPYFSRKDVLRMIEKRHGPIADLFGTGIGLQCQRWDSDIALNIISRLIDEDEVALPVHDSFIVKKSNIGLLQAAMNEAYFERFGFKPDIKIDTGYTTNLLH